jgi:hypothetical protein
VERFVPEYFREGWLPAAREAEKEHFKQRSSKEEPMSFKGFEKVEEGAVDPEEWDQFRDYVEGLIAGEET